jgi:antitoxin component of RelBE/YafQ-DinJ toxin-antitoxin module
MTRTQYLNLRIDPALREAAHLAAASRGLTLSQLIRQYLLRITRRKE